MAKFEIDFEVIKNKEGEVRGLSLIAQPQTEVEVFCSTFPKALVGREADIKFEDDEIVFNHPTCDFSGRCAHKVSNADSVALQVLVSGKRHQLKLVKLEKAGFLTPGVQNYSGLKISHSQQILTHCGLGFPGPLFYCQIF